MLLDIQRLKNGQFAKRLIWVPFFAGIEDKELVGYGLSTSGTEKTSIRETWKPTTEDLLAEDWEYFLDPYGYTKVVEELPKVMYATNFYNVPPNPTVTHVPFKPYTT
jgi:hypothetical protein